MFRSVPKFADFLDFFFCEKFEKVGVCVASSMCSLGCVIAPGGVTSVWCPGSLCFGSVFVCPV